MIGGNSQSSHQPRLLSQSNRQTHQPELLGLWDHQLCLEIVRFSWVLSSLSGIRERSLSNHTASDPGNDAQHHHRRQPAAAAPPPPKLNRDTHITNNSRQTSTSTTTNTAIETQSIILILLGTAHLKRSRIYRLAPPLSLTTHFRMTSRKMLPL